MVCSSYRFPDSKGKQYFDICRENSQSFVEAGQFCVCNSHKSRKSEQGKFAVRQGEKGKTQGI